jgi:hypothetical protein
MTPMNRSEFIKRMGAAALIPFVPNRTNYIEEARNRRPLTNYIDSKITLVTNDDPLNYRTVVHAYDMTLETVMDEYTPFGDLIWRRYWDDGLRDAVTPWERRMTLSNLPDNYDKYELSVWRTERIGQIATVQPTQASTLTTKVFSRSYTLGFPTEVFINLTGRNV